MERPDSLSGEHGRWRFIGEISDGNSSEQSVDDDLSWQNVCRGP